MIWSLWPSIRRVARGAPAGVFNGSEANFAELERLERERGGGYGLRLYGGEGWFECGCGNCAREGVRDRLGGSSREKCIAVRLLSEGCWMDEAEGGACVILSGV